MWFLFYFIFLTVVCNEMKTKFGGSERSLMSKMLCEQTSPAMFKTFQWIFNKTQSCVFLLNLKNVSFTHSFISLYQTVEAWKNEGGIERETFNLFCCFGGSVFC